MATIENLPVTSEDLKPTRNTRIAHYDRRENLAPGRFWKTDRHYTKRARNDRKPCEIVIFPFEDSLCLNSDDCVYSRLLGPVVIRNAKMINAKTACVLARYKRWADERLFESVAQLPPTEVVKPRQTLFRSLMSTLNHNYLIDLIWKANLNQRKHGFTSHDTVLYTDLGKLRQAQHRENDWFVQWANQQTEVTLAEVLDFSFVSGQQFAMSRGAMFLHIVNHSSYHRGWICEMFSEIPAKPPVSDLPFFFETYPFLDV